MTTLPATVIIEGLGAGGDGVASLGGERIFVPLALPGERVRIDRDDRQAAGGTGRRGARRTDRLVRLVEVLEPSPDRVEPPCPVFGRCGGCALQHLATGRIIAWKQQLVREALGRRGLDDVPVAPVRTVPPASRRRASFVAGRRDGAVVLGYFARRQHRIEDIGDQCLVLAPALAALLPALRGLAGAVLDGDGGREVGGELHIAVTLTGSGPDILISGRFEPGPETRQFLAGFAESNDIARIAWQQEDRGRRRGSPEPPEPVVLRHPARCRFGAVEVELPAGAFLQPGREGEAILAGLVTAAAAGAGRIVDLFAGCGAFGFALAGEARVHAVDGDRAAVAAMQAAANGAGLAGRLTVERRDLERRPLTAAELDGFDLAIIDPPRAGAKAQAEALAASTVPVVVSVSCNPATFARDARLLIDGGYVPEPVTPVDQFPFTAHVEAVGVFHRQPRR